MIGKGDIKRAPYVPFKTFLTALDHLYRGTYNPIDRDAFPSASGVVQGQILGALRFFDLIDDHGIRQPKLESLLDPDQRRAELKYLLESYYEFVPHDLHGMTVPRLRKALERYHVTRDTADKAKAFFLAAAKFAGLPLPAQLQRQKPHAPRKAQPSTRPRLALMDLDVDATDEQSQKSTETIELSNGCRVTLSIEADLIHLAPENREFLFRLIDDFNSPFVTSPLKKLKSRDESSVQLKFAGLIADPGEKATWEPGERFGRRARWGNLDQDDFFDQDS